MCGIVLLFIGLGTASSIGEHVVKTNNQLNKEVPANFPGGLLAYWKFDEGSGNTAGDSSGNGYDGTIYGATWVTDGLEFDGVDDYVDLDTHSENLGLDKTDDYVVFAKFKSTSSSTGTIYCMTHTTVTRAFVYLELNSDGTLSFMMGDETCLFEITTPGSYNDGSLHDVEVKYFGEAVNPTLEIYVDGALKNSITDWLCPLLSEDFKTAKIGRRSGESINYFDGEIDEVKIYKATGGNQPPGKPAKPSGTTSGNTGTSYTYTTSTTDPDGDQVYYWFDWGDGKNSGWVGPFASGATGSASHSWTTDGDYNIKVKAKDDPWGEESPFSDPLSVTMPRNRAANINQFLLKFLGQHPNLFPILRYILGL